MRGQQENYNYLEKCGFELVFWDVDKQFGKKKANVDICLTISVLDQTEVFDEAFLMTSDGDFYDLTERLKEHGKLAGVFSPQTSGSCSRLLK